jgi:hypothetical protein
MTKITFASVIFDKDVNREYTEFYLLHMLEGMARSDEEWLRLYPTPPLFKSGVVYNNETTGREDWQDIPTTLESGKGDCKDLAAWYTAEIRSRGGKARCFIRWRKVDGHTTYHVLVLVTLANGKRVIVDPSRRLGMGR